MDGAENVLLNNRIGKRLCYKPRLSTCHSLSSSPKEKLLFEIYLLRLILTSLQVFPCQTGALYWFDYWIWGLGLLTLCIMQPQVFAETRVIISTHWLLVVSLN